MFVRVAHIAAGAAAALALSASATAFQTPESAQEQPEKGTSAAKQERRCETITVTGSRWRVATSRSFSVSQARASGVVSS